MLHVKAKQVNSLQAALYLGTKRPYRRFSRCSSSAKPRPTLPSIGSFCSRRWVGEHVPSAVCFQLSTPYLPQATTYSAVPTFTALCRAAYGSHTKDVIASACECSRRFHGFTPP